jgi:hypothetical protein
MYSQLLDRVQPGARLGKSILDDQGKALLTAGTTLTRGFLDALERRGVISVYVQDGLSDDVVPTDVVTDQLRAAMTGNVSQTFDQVAVLAAARGAWPAGWGRPSTPSASSRWSSAMTVRRWWRRCTPTSRTS